MKAIDVSTPIPELEYFLSVNSWLNSGEKIESVEAPGEGNMNVVIRINTNQRSFIAKQSRPYVNKYRQIPAPLDRISAEKNFYQAVRKNAVSAHIPKILGYDAAEKLLLLEDLGHCQDMTAIYNERKISAAHLDRLVFILGLIHRTDVDANYPDNLQMRFLNHKHIFVIPFAEDNGLDLDEMHEGLQELSLPFKTNKAIKSIVNAIGEKYLMPGQTLVHGDYYPGSWMTEAENLYIIDPEFGFVGFPEFDLGVMAAHIIMATGKKSYLNRIHSIYQGHADKKLLSQIAGIEIARRILGLAQLPMDRSLEEKGKLLKKAQKLILGL
ncbi:phosphotransferase [Pseudozobellia thermophila]|uniref:5-methylthioribose kinase n=1 Tax=Pseudozobellia thermophila TaxID=192903 RepID=A0A1M6D3R5_9FLAO|nr:phosphotransferase [Pseudozobellia thermophila]SHI67723.1 5-methylthioribose kinase [Pseudozobellia thermophila]